jgi:predicted nucleic acid-binding protein
LVPPDTMKTVVMDATVVIHLAKAARFDLLGSLKGWDFVVPDQVVEEVTYPEQAAAFERALRAGHLRKESSTDLAEVALYAELKQRMGKGEAACLAMAATRGWLLASDDRGRAFRRLVGERIGSDRLIGTARIAEAAREQGALTADEAKQIQELARG